MFSGQSQCDILGCQELVPSGAIMDLTFFWTFDIRMKVLDCLCTGKLGQHFCIASTILLLAYFPSWRRYIVIFWVFLRYDRLNNFELASLPWKRFVSSERSKCSKIFGGCNSTSSYWVRFSNLHYWAGSWREIATPFTRFSVIYGSSPDDIIYNACYRDK